MSLQKKPERDCDSIERRLYCRGWNDAIDTTQPPRQPLTDHQTMSMTFNHHWLTSMTLRDAYRLGIRDAEAAHGITKENT